MPPKKTIGELYVKKTQLQHILDIPDTYIGSIEPDNYELYLLNNDNRMEKRMVSFIPGLFKIYDEIIVNAFDQYTRLNIEYNNGDHTIKPVKKIDITLNQTTGEISVMNDGNGIDIVVHPEHKVYIPSMIFGELLTSTNYDKDEKKITGGKNGYGAKLSNIYSVRFNIETVDQARGLKFSQTFYDNMSRSDTAAVKVFKGAPYTVVTFLPDYKRFKCDGLTDDMYDVMIKRVYDLSACTSSNVIVTLNGQKIEYKNFEEYVDLYLGPKTETARVYERVSDRWEIALAMSDNFEQISFVNGINTIKGGKHVEYVLNQVITGIIKEIEKKKKVKVKPNIIRDMLIVFVRSTIENPSFDSQTKETLNTTASKFGSKCEVSETLIKNICKMGIIDRAVSISEVKDNKELKKTDGKKTSSIRGIPKLDDANDAGGKNSTSCTLILTEGDSAKSMAVAGLSVVGRDKYGVFPLRGKILNVQDVAVQKIADNEEISHLKKIIGLESGREYTELSKLRYGKVMIMTDQDSVTGDTPLLLRNRDNNMIEIKAIEDLVDSENFNKTLNREYGRSNYEIWTDDGWTKIKHVMRHYVTKDIYRISTHTGIVDVTEDHSLLNVYGEKITPKECFIGQELLHSFPVYNEGSVDDDFADVIKPGEAWFMGLFWANGSIESYTMETNQDYDTETNGHYFCIHHHNKELLLRAKNEIQKIYNFNFKIIEENTYKYTLILCESSITHPFIHMFAELFYYKKNYNTKNNDDTVYSNSNKYIPNIILNSHRHIRESFIEGYNSSTDIDCGLNNDIINTESLYYKCVHIKGKIATQCMYTLLKSIGYYVYVTLSKNNIKNAYILSITRNPIRMKENTIIQMINLGKTPRYVYDLETVNHHFQAGIGKTIVHNTDGSHIKGLLFNIFKNMWPSLMKMDGFLSSMMTPIVKVTKNSEKISFITLQEFEIWKSANNGGKGWDIKYYKGLGTSTTSEAKEYFQNMNVVDYEWTDNSYNSLDLAFNKSRADDRKEWLSHYDRDKILDISHKKINYESFVNDELIHFSNCDLERSIPSICDGLKVSTRKILYSAFKRKLYYNKKEIRVAQLAGYVSEHSAYHHGEASLQGAIIGMAQNFVCSNNINLLSPNGQFGCIDPETPVLLWNGKTEKAKNIKIGDTLIGDDGDYRTVEKLTSGIDEMYEIKNGYMDSYTVNSHHILTLYYEHHKNIYVENTEDIKLSFLCIDYIDHDLHVITRKKMNNTSHNYSEMVEFAKDIPDNKILDIDVQEYLLLPKDIRIKLKGVVNSSIIQWPDKDIAIDPYIVGSMLLVNEMDTLSDDYIINSYEKRIALLAGVIDTHGIIIHEDNCYSYEISMKLDRNNILESLRIISGSLGFRAKIKTDICTLVICGENINSIPVRLPIKQISHKNKIINNQAISVKHIGPGEYCGWNIDKNERFLLGDFTITHNTRIKGGKDSASPRYIHTLLTRLSMTIFREDDFPLLKYLDDDGLKIEPEFYVPIIPMVLVNGSIGIGTGYSTNIPCYNPLDIVINIKILLNTDSSSASSSSSVIELKKMKPWYLGFKGEIYESATKNCYVTKGKYTIIDNNTVEINELPIGEWSDDYKEFLEGMLIDNEKDKERDKDKDKKKTTKKRYLIDYENHYTESSVKFILHLEKGTIKELDKQTGQGCTFFEKEFKLISSKLTNTNNMHLYDRKGIIKKYIVVEDILRDYYVVRLEYYVKRKEYVLQKLERELKILMAKVSFIEDVVSERLKIGKYKRDDLKMYLSDNNYPKICDKKRTVEDDDDSDNTNSSITTTEYYNDEVDGNYDYLIRLPVYTLTLDTSAELAKTKNDKENEIEELRKRTIRDIWNSELDEFVVEYNKYYKNYMEELENNGKIKPIKKRNKAPSGKGLKK